jgi:hypothetical protein
VWLEKPRIGTFPAPLTLPRTHALRQARDLSKNNPERPTQNIRSFSRRKVDILPCHKGKPQRLNLKNQSLSAPEIGDSTGHSNTISHSCASRSSELLSLNRPKHAISGIENLSAQMPLPFLSNLR